MGIVELNETLYKASALWADAFYKWICQYVCLYVCVSVCSLLRYRLNVFLPPLPEIEYPNLLEILNPWGKVMERSGLRFENFYKIAAQKQACFWANFALLSRIFCYRCFSLRLTFFFYIRFNVFCPHFIDSNVQAF